MKGPLRIGLIAGIVGALVVAGIEVALAGRENDFFQFCTTKAYGWPAPWKVEYCECKKSETVYPTSSKLVNVAAVGGTGILCFALLAGVARTRERLRQRSQRGRSGM